MHLKTAALLASAWLASSAFGGTAFGQTVNTGNEVRVNPVAGGRGGMLLYPGGQYARTVPRLLQPGETVKDLGPVRLHMPVKHAARPKTAEADTASAKSAPKPKAAPKVAQAAPKTPKPSKPAQTAAAPNPPGYTGGYGNFGMPQGAAALSAVMTPSAPSTPAAQPAPKNPPRQQTAKANPPPASSAPAPSEEPPTPGLTKRSVILFAPQAADPAQSALGALKFLAGDLNAAMSSPASRVQIQAFGGTRGDKGSDARRLSLKRALAIRQVLIDDGVPAERIDVRAMGGVDDSGPADRVDVYIKA